MLPNQLSEDGCLHNNGAGGPPPHDDEIGLIIVEMRFPFGQVVATPGALDALAKTGELAALFLARHGIGDWGVLSEEDIETNEHALANGGRLMSAYDLADGQRLWIITEWDRSVTTLLLPDDY